MEIIFTESEWQGFKTFNFKFEGRNAILVFPKEVKPEKKWLIKTEYFGAFPNFEIEMLKRGYHLAYLSNVTRWHHESDTDAKARFADFLNKEFGLNKKCVPVGMSCGGLQAVYFAAKYPEKIAALYLDAPVMNYLSCPYGIGKKAQPGFIEEFEKATGKTASDMINYRNHPIDNAPKLIENGIPVILVAGDSDVVVPYNENGKALYELYKSRGGEIELYLKPGCDHHPHGLSDPTPIINFVEKHYN
jgi:pimeloyl-ACP methyl ester carboxylesterase